MTAANNKSNDSNHSAERLHALDNLRAAMMWLGIVIHVAVIYVVMPSPLPWHDDQSTSVADFLMAFIHAFRMPVFFILAGFFVALLVQKGGVRGMLKNRLRRLALPFALFWPVLVSCVAVLALLFLNRKAGAWGFDRTLMPQGPNGPITPGTMHLWFLWMLLWLSVLTAAACWLADRLPAAIPSVLAKVFGRLAGARWGFLALSVPLAWFGSFYANGIVTPNVSFMPAAAEWLHNGLFYVFGWYLFRNQQALFALYTRRWPWHAAAGLVFFLATGVLVERLARPGAAGLHLPLWIALVYNCASWLWSFALIGLFLRYLQRPHAWLGYLSESSYWVYLVHFPLTVGFGALLLGLPLPALAKIGINLLATTAVCLASYHLFVRFTAVSVLLNGRRHTRKKLTGEPVHAT